MLSWVRGLSTENLAAPYGYDGGRRWLLGRLDETEDGVGCWRHRRPRALQPAVGDRRRDPRPARRPETPLSVEGARPRLLRGRGGRALAPGARHLRGGFVLRVSEELWGVVQKLQGVRPGSPGVWNVREAPSPLRA